MLVDIVSKNGNLLLNIPLRGDGTLDAARRRSWRNGDVDGSQRRGHLRHAAVEVFGEGPPKWRAATLTKTNCRYTAEDIRFTTKGNLLYAMAMDWPASGELTVRSLTGNVSGVRMLGVADPLRFTAGDFGLVIEVPPSRPCEHAYTLRIEGAPAA